MKLQQLPPRYLVSCTHLLDYRLFLWGLKTRRWVDTDVDPDAHVGYRIEAETRTLKKALAIARLCPIPCRIDKRGFIGPGRFAKYPHITHPADNNFAYGVLRRWMVVDGNLKRVPVTSRPRLPPRYSKSTYPR